MNYIKATLAYCIKRPAIIIYMAVVTLIGTIIGFLNPLSSLLKICMLLTNNYENEKFFY